jgi:hypothetical protein
MKARHLAAMAAAAGLGLIPAASAEDRHDRVEKQTLQQAVAFEKHKEQAAQRQARMERRQGTGQSRADRESKASADRIERKQTGGAAAKPEKQPPR